MLAEVLKDLKVIRDVKLPWITVTIAACTWSNSCCKTSPRQRVKESDDPSLPVWIVCLPRTRST